ncbi:1-acylglycerol-3-phosphate O-acyltransferase [Aureococcus anophagefferens]|nr:1-acylglycerol-3-phosphate O-acyltransferase [Aureococcus anophagefferens]
MGAPKNALQLPMKLEDYKPVSYATTACLFAIAIAGWVATWCAQMAFTYSVGLTMSKKRLEFWNGYIFRLLAAAPVANLTPGVTVTKTRTSWTPTKAMTDGKSPVMVICNHRSYMDPFALASELLPLETKYVAKSDLFKVPFGGWAMKNAGDLAVRFDANKNAGWGTVKGSTGQLLAQAAAHFEAGNSVRAVVPVCMMGADECGGAMSMRPGTSSSSAAARRGGTRVDQAARRARAVGNGASTQ